LETSFYWESSEAPLSFWKKNEKNLREPQRDDEQCILLEKEFEEKRKGKGVTPALQKRSVHYMKKTRIARR